MAAHCSFSRRLAILSMAVLVSCASRSNSDPQLDNLLRNRLVLRRVVEVDHLLNFEWPTLVRIEVEYNERVSQLVFLMGGLEIRCHFFANGVEDPGGVVMHAGSPRALRLADCFSSQASSFEGDEAHNLTLLVEVLRGSRKVLGREWKRIRPDRETTEDRSQ